MKRSLFVTGCTGFIGSQLLRSITSTEYNKIYCLSRSDNKQPGYLSEHNNVTFIKGDIYDTKVYAPYLASADVLIHLAAVTGKAKQEEYFKVNAKGTECLMLQCRDLGVRKVLFISSIAVTFSNKLGYYYAQSKEIGEAAVRNSGLDFTIVRPTIVIARGSPLFERLSMLARQPVILMFGDGTKTIQPIYIGDLVECLLYILRNDVFCNETYELGGPEAITVENFVKAIRHVSSGKRSIVVHVPLKAVMGVISIFDKYFHSLLPVSAGQLSVFDNDGSIRPNRVFSALVPKMKAVDEMLQLVIEDAK